MAVPDIESQQQAKAGASLTDAVAAAVQGSAHAGALLAHTLVPASALAFYLLGGVAVSSFVGHALPVVLLQLAAFWITKNVSGRLLVGLRWWSAPSGLSFEHRPAPYAPRLADRQLFWALLWAPAVLWPLLGLASAMRLSPSWLAVDACGAFLAATNLASYRRCATHAGARSRASPSASVIANRILGSAIASAI